MSDTKIIVVAQGEHHSLYDITESPVAMDFPGMNPVRVFKVGVKDVNSIEHDIVRDYQVAGADHNFPYDCDMGMAIFGFRTEIEQVADRLLDYLKSNALAAAEDHFDDLTDDTMDMVGQFEVAYTNDVHCAVITGYAQEFSEELDDLVKSFALPYVQFGAQMNDYGVFDAIWDEDLLRDFQDVSFLYSLRTKLAIHEPSQEQFGVYPHPVTITYKSADLGKEHANHDAWLRANTTAPFARSWGTFAGRDAPPPTTVEYTFKNVTDAMMFAQAFV